MLNTTTSYSAGSERIDFCDIRVWSGDCEHTASPSLGDKYLCEMCGTVPKLEHEVRPSALCYVSGDYDKLS